VVDEGTMSSSVLVDSRTTVWKGPTSFSATTVTPPRSSALASLSEAAIGGKNHQGLHWEPEVVQSTLKTGAVRWEMRWKAMGLPSEIQGFEGTGRTQAKSSASPA
jgi:hypothetical protein